MKNKFEVEDFENAMDLVKKYRQSIKHGFNNVFGRAAREETNRMVDKLAKMGITEYCDTFGTVKIKKWEY